MRRSREQALPDRTDIHNHGDFHVSFVAPRYGVGDCSTPVGGRAARIHFRGGREVRPGVTDLQRGGAGWPRHGGGTRNLICVAAVRSVRWRSNSTRIRRPRTPRSNPQQRGVVFWPEYENNMRRPACYTGGHSAGWPFSCTPISKSSRQVRNPGAAFPSRDGDRRSRRRMPRAGGIAPLAG